MGESRAEQSQQFCFKAERPPCWKLRNRIDSPVDLLFFCLNHTFTPLLPTKTSRSTRSRTHSRFARSFPNSEEGYFLTHPVALKNMELPLRSLTKIGTTPAFVSSSVLASPDSTSLLGLDCFRVMV